MLLRCPESSNGQTWEKVGEIDPQPGIPNYILPLDREGWYLGFALFDGIVKDGKASPLALYRAEGDAIILKELVDLPFRDRSHIGALETSIMPIPASVSEKNPNQKPRIRQRCLVRPASLNPDFWLPVILPDYLVLGASKAGVLWTISLKNGQCRQTIDLGGVETNNLEKLDLLNHFLLGAQPNKENQLLVLTRDPDSLSIASSLSLPAGSPVEVRRENVKRYSEMVEGLTNVQWWVVNPETGSKEQPDSMEELPSRAPFSHQGRMKFLVGPDGHVHANPLGPWKEILEQLSLDNQPAPTLKAPAAPAPSPAKETIKEKLPPVPEAKPSEAAVRPKNPS